MSQSIQPIGERSRRILDELLMPMNPGDLLTHDRWRAIGNEGDLRTARNRLRRDRGRWLRVVPGVGYRMLRADEHDKAQDDHKRRAGRQVNRIVQAGEDALQYPAEITREKAAEYEEINRHFRAIHREMRKQAREIREVKARSESHEDRLSRIERQLKELQDSE